MKKFTAIAVAVVMLFTCLFVAACQNTGLTVTLHFLNGNTKQVIPFDENFQMPADPVREGYKFEGWYADENYTQKWTVPETLENSVHLYAKWSQKQSPDDGPDVDPDVTVYVTFNYNYAGGPDPVTKNCKSGTNVTFPSTPARENYSFDGWYTAETGGNRVSTLAPTQQNTTLYAHWTPVVIETVKVTFNFNYDNAPDNEVVSVNKGVSVTRSAPSPRSGYVFDGWYTQAVGGEEWNFSSAVNADTVLYAQWSQEKLFVVFDLQYSRAPYAVEEVTEGETVTFPQNVQREGYTFQGWYTEPTAGTRLSSYQVGANAVFYAHWTSSAGHTHQFDSYFEYSVCKVDGCNVVGRNDSIRSFDSSFVYSFNSDVQIAINSYYETLLNSIKSGKDYDRFVQLYNQYYAYVEYVGTQYQIAQVFYDAYGQQTGDVFDKNFDVVSEYYTNCEADFNKLYKNIYDSPFRSKFYDEWTKEQIDNALSLAEGAGESADSFNEVARIAGEYNDLLAELENSYSNDYSKLYAKFNRFVNANNKLAKQAGYDNYMDYAYENVYGREYTPQDVASMRAYVKQYVAPMLSKLYGMEPSQNYLTAQADLDFYYAVMTESLFTMPEDGDEAFGDAVTAVNSIARYFEFLQSVSYDMDFYNAANELFKAGNYYVGTSEGAYTYWIPAANKSTLYFDNSYDYDYGYTYSTSFTFIHEFGHYYNGVHNQGGEISYDHDETQSQGNEMLYLAYLKHNKPSNVSKGYKYVEYYQLVTMLENVVKASMVDEFEQAVYSDTYAGYENGIAPSQYGKLYSDIAKSYGSAISSNLNDTYWMYVCVDNAAYYISYAMSALPGLELFVKGQASAANLELARDSYFRLFQAVRRDNITTYEQALEYASLDNPFQEKLYTTLNDFFKTYTL